MSNPQVSARQAEPTKYMKRSLGITKLNHNNDVQLGGLHGKKVLSCSSERGETVLHGRIFSNVDYDTARVFVSRGTYVPVLAIDDQPITAGFGEVRILVSPGWHLITVQIQNRIDSSVKSFPIYVEDGKSACFDYVGSPQGWKNEVMSFDQGCYIGNLGEKGITRTDKIRADKFSLWLGSAVAAGYASTCLFLPFLIATFVPYETDNNLLRFLISSILFLLALAGTMSIVKFYRRMKKEDNSEIEATKELGREMGKHSPVPWNFSHPSISRIHCLGQGDECDVNLNPEKAAVIIDSDLRQGQKKNPGEIELASNKEIPPQTKVYCPAPRVYLDGELLPTGWTRWWMELDPGRHVLRMDLVDENNRRSGERGISVGREEVIEILPGQIRNVKMLTEVEYEFKNGLVNAPRFKLLATAEYIGQSEKLSIEIKEFENTSKTNS